MTTFQKIIKYLAIALALFLVIGILETVLGVIGIVGGLFDKDAVTEDLRSYEVSAEIDRLEIEIGAADFKIVRGSACSVESNLSKLTVKEQNGTLIIKQQTTRGVTEQKAALTLCIPEGKVFDRVELITGAGRLTVEQLSAETLVLELGAGEVRINELNASREADIAGGAGQITVDSGVLHDLDLEMGVGELNLTAALTGDCELELGIGQSNIKVLGDRAEYRLDLQKGLGSLTVDGVDVSNTKANTGGHHSLTIHGGIGAIYVDFVQSAN